MKKLILSVTAIAGFSMASFAQGTITFDGHLNPSSSPTATSGGRVFLSGVLDTTIDINAELLYSTTGAAGTFNPVVTLLNSAAGVGPAGSGLGQVIDASGDVSGDGDGTFADQSGQSFVIPLLAGGTSVFFEVMGWTGTGTTYANAPLSATVGFSEVLSAASSPSQAVIDQMPALNLVAVPEPSTLAMAGVGLASMLMFRRRNK